MMWVCVLIMLGNIGGSGIYGVAPTISTVSDLKTKADCERVAAAADGIYQYQRVQHTCTHVGKAS